MKTAYFFLFCFVLIWLALLYCEPQPATLEVQQSQEEKQ
jgi:hypothetical protein